MNHFVWSLKLLVFSFLAILGGLSLWSGAPDLLKTLAGGALVLAAIAFLIAEFFQISLTRRGSPHPAKVQIETGETFNLLSSEFDSHARALFSAMSDLSATDLSTPQRRQILSLRRSLEQLNTLQQDSVQFMRMVSKDFVSEENRFAVEELVWATLTPLLARFMSPDTELVCTIADDVPPEIRCNRDLFSILLQHLLQHATAVTVRGEVTLSLSVERPHPRATVLALAVSDSGPGIARAQLDKAFQPFALPQGPNGRRLTTSGLALALSRQAAQLLQGSLHLSSIEGKGSTIVFRMNLTDSTSSQKNKSGPTENRISKQSIVIDDSKGNLRLLRGLLEQEGHIVHTFESPRDALQFLRDSEQKEGFRLDNLFLDDSIDDFDFAAVTRYITSHREIVRHATLMTHVPAIAKKTGKAIEPGFDVQLPKPVRRSDLLCVLAKEPIPVRKRPPSKIAEDFADSIRASRRNEAAASRSMIESAQSDGSKPIGPRQAVCLVVDDNLVNMHTVSSLLRTKNIEVLLAENGKEAVELFAASRQVDFILMDLQMPELDGYEATRRIRQMERDMQRHTPIIALTAFSTRSEQERCIATGMDGFLSKPVHASDLFDLLQSYSIGFDTACELLSSSNAQAH